MKKIFLFLAIAGTAVFTGCSDDEPDQDTIAKVIETPPLDFNASGDFANLIEFGGQIYDADVVLVYRLARIDGFDVWQPLPRTEYVGPNAEGEVDYDFNFRPTDVEIVMQSNEFADLNNLPALTQNQIFRIVRVPGYFASTINTSDYDAVMSALESKGGVEVNKIEK